MTDPCWAWTQKIGGQCILGCPALILIPGVAGCCIVIKQHLKVSFGCVLLVMSTQARSAPSHPSGQEPFWWTPWPPPQPWAGPSRPGSMCMSSPGRQVSDGDLPTIRICRLQPCPLLQTSSVWPNLSFLPALGPSFTLTENTARAGARAILRAWCLPRSFLSGLWHRKARGGRRIQPVSRWLSRGVLGARWSFGLGWCNMVDRRLNRNVTWRPRAFGRKSLSIGALLTPFFQFCDFCRCLG